MSEPYQEKEIILRSSLNKKSQLFDLTSDGHLRLHLHQGQLKAWDSQKRIIAVIAGTRSGKTSFGPLWLWREMQRKGPGDYLVAAPTNPLLDKAAAPEIGLIFEKIFGLGSLRTRPLQFIFSPDGMRQLWGHVPARKARVIFGHATDPESLEGMTAKAAWLDEAGQKKFKLESFETIKRRLQIDEGRMLITTTPYSLGWLKQKLHDPWVEAKKNHPEIDVIGFESRMNPAFPIEEWEKSKRDLPGWKFDLFYRAIFTRPAGLIYGCFDNTLNTCDPFTIEEWWPRWIGLDFGAVNTAGIFLAEEMDGTKQYPGNRTGRLFAYREYFPPGEVGGSERRTAKEHVLHLKRGEPKTPRAVGGTKSEDQYRRELSSAGLPIQECPVSEVEVGIDRVYGAMQRHELIIFKTLTGLLDEIGRYSRELDEQGNPTEEIEDKETYHRLDALRYIIAWLKGGKRKLNIGW